MARVAIITTLDYELFGDGSGVVQREQIIPTAHLANIYDLYGAKLTIMFEYGQFRAYKKFAKYNSNFLEDNKKIEAQLIDLVKRGHDIQLHYHPQWHYARYNKDTQKIDVNLDYIDMSSLPENELKEVLKEAKEFLEELLKPYKSNYECIAFRAGSWAVKDEAKLLKALKNAGFRADSSVVPNVKFKSCKVNFEYTNCPSQYKYWYCKESLSKGEDGDFLEFPNYTLKSRLAFLKYFNPKAILSKKITSHFYKVKISEKNHSKFNKISKILNRDYYMADINNMSYKSLIDMVERVLNSNSSDEIIPLIFIGHPKVSFAIDDMHLFFEHFKNSKKVEFWGFAKAIEYVLEAKNSG